MKKTLPKKIIAGVTAALVLAAGVLPGVAFAADIPIERDQPVAAQATPTPTPTATTTATASPTTGTPGPADTGNAGLVGTDDGNGWQMAALAVALLGITAGGALVARSATRR